MSALNHKCFDADLTHGVREIIALPLQGGDLTQMRAICARYLPHKSSDLLQEVAPGFSGGGK